MSGTQTGGIGLLLGLALSGVRRCRLVCVGRQKKDGVR